jgi:hypothetical protein
MIIDMRVWLSGGIWFDDHSQRCTVYDNSHLFGGLSLVVGAFAAYILFFRPDIYKEVNAIIWIFRVIFPFGFGLAGLAMLSCSGRAMFDAKMGTFFCKRTYLFRSVTQRGCLREMTQIVLNARHQGPEEHPGPEGGRYYMYWYLKLSMELGGERVLLRKWRCRIQGRRSQNVALVEAQAEAKRLALLINRPLAFEEDRG